MSRYGPQIAAVARRADRDRDRIDPAAGGPELARELLHEGAGRAVWLYVQCRTGGRPVALSAAEYRALEDAVNTWLSLYAACHGVDLESAVPLRTAAETLLETRNIEDTAQLLTDVPRRRPDQ